MTSEILRVVIFVIAISALTAQFVYDLVQSRDKKKDNDNLKTALHQLQSDNDTLKTEVSQIRSGVNELVAKGKITKAEAQAVLNITLESLKADIKAEVKTPQPD